jgi:hypothetical protein
MIQPHNSVRIIQEYGFHVRLVLGDGRRMGDTNGSAWIRPNRDPIGYESAIGISHVPIRTRLSTVSDIACGDDGRHLRRCLRLLRVASRLGTEAVERLAALTVKIGLMDAEVPPVAMVVPDALVLPMPSALGVATFMGIARVVRRLALAAVIAAATTVVTSTTTALTRIARIHFLYIR